jgi:hypothetical protein
MVTGRGGRGDEAGSLPLAACAGGRDEGEGDGDVTAIGGGGDAVCDGLECVLPEHATCAIKTNETAARNARFMLCALPSESS